MGLSRKSARLPRGIPAASLKLHLVAYHRRNNQSSAGNTRGLIEAHRRGAAIRRFPSLPRGIPAASLKRVGYKSVPRLRVGLPRGIPAASLKRRPERRAPPPRPPSSAGNTRGLIEAAY